MKFSYNFIKANDKISGFDEFVPAPYFRKKFNIDFKSKKAEITICGLGFYELYINGKNITKGLLAPYTSNPDQLCYYDNYDITELLNKGENVVGVILGTGMRSNYGGFIWDLDKADCRGPVTFAMCLEATDGEKVFELEADESFKTAPSPILYEDLRLGYCYDATKEYPGWNTVDFDDSNWGNALIERKPKGFAKLCTADPIVVTKELVAKTITHYDELPFAYHMTEEHEPIKESIRKDVYVYDFGVNSAGLTKLKINGKPGQKITIRHGEALINGKFALNTTLLYEEGTPNYAESVAFSRILNYSQADTFICKGGEETFIPKFKYDGFRYAYVEGLEEEQATEEALTYLVMNSDVRVRAEFECSDETLNKLQECTRISDLANMYYYPTDCPHREKLGWTGDISVSAEQYLLNLTVENSLREWFTNIRYVQRVDGALPAIIPTGGWGFEWGNGPAWDSVCVVAPYYVYKYTGNKDVITENVSMIMRYLCYIQTRREENGLVEFGLGDWLDPNQHKNNEMVYCPLILSSSIMTFDIANKAAHLFREIGKEYEYAYAKSLADDMKKCIRKHLIDKNTMIADGECQSSQALMLAMGMFNDDEVEEAQKRLVEIIHKDGDHNGCGQVGGRYIYHVLSKMGETELAYKMITSKHRTGYGYWLENGATSLWESFRPVDHKRATSQNHHMRGDISSWFIQELAGLKPNPYATDISHFEISPKFIDNLSYAKAHFDSKFGRISTHWERKDDKIILSVIAPAGTRGEIVMSDGYKFSDNTYTKEWSYTDKESKFCLEVIK